MAILCTMNDGCAVSTLVIFFVAAGVAVLAGLASFHKHRHSTSLIYLALFLAFAMIVLGLCCAWFTKPGCDCGGTKTAATAAAAAAAGTEDDETVVDEEDTGEEGEAATIAADTVVTTAAASVDPFGDEEGEE